MPRRRNLSSSGVVKVQHHLWIRHPLWRRPFSLRFYVECFDWLRWLFLRNTLRQESRTTNHSASPRRSSIHCAIIARPLPLFPAYLSPPPLLWLLNSARRPWAKKANWKWRTTTPLTDVLSRHGTHIRNQLSKPHSVIYWISSWTATATWYPSLESWFENICLHDLISLEWKFKSVVANGFLNLRFDSSFSNIVGVLILGPMEKSFSATLNLLEDMRLWEQKWWSRSLRWCAELSLAHTLCESDQLIY